MFYTTISLLRCAIEYYIFIFIVFTCLNLFIFIVIKKGYLGVDIKEYFNYLLESNKRLNLFSLFMFIISFSILFIITKDVIYLDDENVVVIAKIDNTTFQLSGDVINIIFQNLCSAGVFSASARIAASLLAKHKLSLLPKTGIIGGTVLGFTASFKLVNHMLSAVNTGIVTVETGPIEVTIDKLNLLNGNRIEDVKGLFNKSFVVNNFSDKVILTDEVIGGAHKIQGVGDASSVIIKELDKQNPT